MTRSVGAQAQMPAAPHRAARVAERLIDGELVLYDPLYQRVHVLNPTAAVAWRLSDGEHTVADVVAALVEHYPDSRPAIDRWMPLRMLGAVIPRETMLMTSVSASTAQMLLTTSGLSACCDKAPISSWAMPR